MYFQQFYLSCLAHASYMIGSEGIAAVVDPQRDVEIYLEDAQKHGLEDCATSSKRTCMRTLSPVTRNSPPAPERRFTWGYVREHNSPITTSSDGDEISFGRAVLRFLETPGHSG